MNNDSVTSLMLIIICTVAGVSGRRTDTNRGTVRLVYFNLSLCLETSCTTSAKRKARVYRAAVLFGLPEAVLDLHTIGEGVLDIGCTNL